MTTRALLPLLATASLLTASCGGLTASSPAEAADAGASDSAVTDDRESTFDAGAIDAAPTPSGVVIFAGDGPDLLKDTWEWSSGTWNEKKVSGPPTRYEHQLASLGKKIVLFGGEVGSQELGDTWEWDGAAWTEKKIMGPPPRSRHAMASLGAGGGTKIVLYGGMGTGSGQLDDTWEYDGTAWTEKKIPGPHAFDGMAIAALADKIVLFDGFPMVPVTWEYDGTAWTSKKLPGPSSRVYASMATLGGKVVLFGGETDANHYPNDTWEYDGVAWTEKTVATSPSARLHQAMTTVSVGNDHVIVLFGGGNEPAGTSPPWLGDTWTYDGTSWTPRASVGPEGRYVYTIAARGND